MSVYIFGFMVSIIQIVAIGAQNSFILRNGLLGNIFIPVLICSICDILLISFGVFGVAELMTKNKLIMSGFQIFGAVFLFLYGINSFKKSIKGGYSIDLEDENLKKSWLKLAIGGIFVSIVNPNAWLDATIIIGAMASEYINISDRAHFYLGAITASVVWFTALGAVSKLLIPVFKNPISWRVLDFIIGLFMLFLGYRLIS